jgi:curved DNA-binding protein
VENGSFIDYYDFLMISPTADRQMVEWAARLMLARYDPQKSKTPDEKKCELVKEAFRTLADPKKRATYDTELTKQKPAVTIDVKAEVTLQDVVEAQHLRRAIMTVLYQAVMRKPRDPDVGRTDLARLVGVTAQDLEFALWFLREKDWITATQAGSYAITVTGAEWVETGGVPELAVGGADGAHFQQGLGALGRGVSTQAGPGVSSNGRPQALPPAASGEASAPADGGTALKLTQKIV